MLNGIVSGAEKDITRIPMQAGGVYKEGWEVRDNQDRIIWGREDELQTATGTLPFKGYGLPAKVKSLLGNTQQTGTPSPDNPVMPEFVGVRTGNLFDGSVSEVSRYLNSDGNISTSSSFNISDYISCDAETTYTIENVNGNSVTPSVCFYSSQKDFLGGVSYNRSSGITFSTPADCAYLKVSYKKNMASEAMLNLGSTALPYEPYGYKISLTNAGQTFPVYLGQTPTLRRIKKRVFDGTENWTMWEYQTAVMFYTPVADGTELLIVSSHFGTRKTGSMPLTGNVAYNGNSNKNMLFRMMDDTTITTVEGFKAYLAAQYAAGTPVTVWYVLAEPTTGIVNEPLAKIGDYADELTEISVHGLSAPLYGTGDYKDILNLATGVVTRKIKKLVVTGDEGWVVNGSGENTFRGQLVLEKNNINSMPGYCTHLKFVTSGLSVDQECIGCFNNSVFMRISRSIANDFTAFKSYLTNQYQNGTPVTIWYVLAEPETETVIVPTGMTGEIEGYLTQNGTPTPANQIIPKWNGKEETGGTYSVVAYTLPEIPTTTGQNTLTVDTTLAPSEMTVKGHIKLLS